MSQNNEITVQIDQLFVVNRKHGFDPQEIVGNLLSALGVEAPIESAEGGRGIIFSNVNPCVFEHVVPDHEVTFDHNGAWWITVFKAMQAVQEDANFINVSIKIDGEGFPTQEIAQTSSKSLTVGNEGFPLSYNPVSLFVNRAG